MWFKKLKDLINIKKSTKLKELERKDDTAFAEAIRKKYQHETPYLYGSNLIYYKKKIVSVKTDTHQHVRQLITKEFYNRIQQYEKKYYQMVTNQDNRKFISTIEEIYNQPGEKKQMIHLFHKFGVVTKNQREWQETRQTLRKYEEELVRLKKQIKVQEELYLQIKDKEMQPISARSITREVMENIKREIRMERLRYGPD